MLFFLFFFPLQTTGSSDIIINEIAWMGTEKSTADEWIELYNGSTSSLVLDGWTLKSATGTLKIVLKGTVAGKGFYLLERTDDDTLPNIKADLIYSGALKNTGEGLELYDNFVNLADSVNCAAGWPAGDNQTKQTMERTGLLEWQTSQNPGGTPKAENSTTTKNQTIDQGKKDYPSGIVINEILPSPEGPDSENEWIEIFNQNDFGVDLSGWKIFDAVGTVKIYVFPANTEISPKGFLVLPRPSTGITLNNEGDGLKLSNPDGKIIDSVSYEKAPTGSSYNRFVSDWFWSTIPTPGLTNQTASPGEGKKGEIKKDNSQEKQSNLESKELAAVSEPFKEIGSKQNPKSFLTPLTALIISLFSGIVILLLKKKVKSLN